MNKLNRLLLVIFCLLQPTAAFAALFDEDAPLNIEIQADFSLLERERDKAADYPGMLTIGEFELPIELNVRGNNRLKKTTCKNSPLKIDFKKSDLRKQTIFHKEGDLKLVVQCKNGGVYRDYLRAEYLAYKMINAITPLSYGVRWVNVVYKTNDKTIGERPAFLVEHKKRVAKRNNADLEQPKNLPEYNDLAPVQTALIEQLQYFLGNADYSLLRSAEPGECCHNAKLVHQDAQFAPIIYDFDSSGLVATSYATPPPNLKIRSVRQRIFRGYCQSESALQAARAQILAAQETILSLVKSDQVLSKSGIKKTLRYVTESFKHFREDKIWNKNILQACR